MNLLIAILRFPWWVHFAIAGLVFYGGHSMQDSVKQAQADLEIALAAEAPDAVPLEFFEPSSDIGLLKEGRVLAQINTDYNYRLINKTNGVTTSETAMYVLFGQDADENETNVQAVVMVAPRNVDAFADWAMESFAGIGSMGFVYDFHGRFSSSHGKSSLARDALRDEGLTPAPNMQFISPYLEGREAGLQKAASGSEGSQTIVYAIALAFVLLGVAKLVFSRAFGSKRRGNGGFGGGSGSPEPLSPVDTSRGPQPLMAQSAMQNGAAQAQAANPLNALISEHATNSAAQPSAPSVGRNATRAAKLMEKQRMLAQSAPAEQSKAAMPPMRKRMSALEQARAFRRTVTSSPEEAKGFRAKMKEDPFAKLGR